MPTTKTEDENNTLHHVGLLVPIKLKKRIDDWRRKQPGLPNRSTAIRALIELSLDQEKRRASAA